MSVATSYETASASPRLQTIGAVCRRLKPEFPDISISKIRYLEDQGLLAPRRTQGGYRLFGEDDVERLETILRLQRDEFLPLRVIRQQLATAVPKGKRRRRAALASAEEQERDARGAVRARRASRRPPFVTWRASACCSRRLGAASGATGSRTSRSPSLCTQLAGYGMSARHLRTFQTSADRNAGAAGADHRAQRCMDGTSSVARQGSRISGRSAS